MPAVSQKLCEISVIHIFSQGTKKKEGLGS